MRIFRRLPTAASAQANSRPAAKPAPAAQAAVPPKAGSTLTRPQSVRVTPKDVLTVQATKGMTYYELARRFGADASDASATKAYVAELQKLNGPKLIAGQAVKLPQGANASFKLPSLIAAQKALGKGGASLDWTAAAARWGYAEALYVKVGKKEIAVVETGEDMFSVQDARAREKAAGL